MPKLRAHNIAVSLDGFMAGPAQSLDDPLGKNGPRLHGWVFKTRAGLQMFGQTGGEEGIDNDHIADGLRDIGATIMGRNMFGPIRGPWLDDEWKGWWEENPPFHHPVFVLTHHHREPLVMEGGTTFYFVDDPIEAVLARAFEAAGGSDVRLGGGASTIRQFLRAGLLDELHLAIVPILLGEGERPLDDSALGAGAYECVNLNASSSVVHVHLSKVAGDPA